MLDRFRAAKPIASPTQRPSSQLIEFLKGWEKCRLAPYKDQGGKWTIGWGHLMGPTESHAPITQDTADRLLGQDVGYAADRVHSLTFGLLTQARFDALVSFVFNLGSSKAVAESTLLRYVNEGRYDDAAGEFWKWRNVRNETTGKLEVSAGVVKRRAAEKDIFLFGDYEGRP